MNWNTIYNFTQVEEIQNDSSAKFHLIYKHSSRCSLSSMVLDRLQRGYQPIEKDLELHFLDLIRYREISDYISDLFNVQHQSPQVILLNNGKVVYHESHFGIDYTEIKKRISDN